MRSRKFLLAGFALWASSVAFGAEEPSFCQPDAFLKDEIHDSVPDGLVRLHTFRMGKSIVAGLAVGMSHSESVKDLSQIYSRVDSSKKYCTWYFNRWDQGARKMFNWKYLSHPGSSSLQSEVEEYGKAFSAFIDEESPSMLSCLESERYIAFGCDGMMHRGPTVFAMLLSFAGCTPAHSTEIANGLWGLNGVPPEVRLAIAQRAYEIGQTKHQTQERLVQLLSGY